MSSGGSAELFEPARHGDADAEPGVTDFAVNVQPGPPDFLRAALRARIDDLAAYPSAADEDRALEAVAAHHGRSREEILLLDGAAEGFELLTRLQPRHAALIAPSFTEPGRVLRAAGARVTDVVLDQPWRLSQAQIPPDADLVVLGNPTNPTSVLHDRAEIVALTRPGRLVVVDEAFADLTLEPSTGAPEPASLAAELPAGTVVIRSLTKTFGLAGLRVGYLLAAPEVIDRLRTARRHWPLGTLALTAVAECLGPAGTAYAAGLARGVARDRAALVDALSAAGVTVPVTPSAPYVLIEVPDGLAVKARLRARGFGVRSCANFTGLTADHLRIAVRPPEVSAGLVAALHDCLEELATESLSAAPTTTGDER